MSLNGKSILLYFRHLDLHMLNYIQGDLLTTKHPVIAHGVSEKCVFGLGIAKQIAQVYTKAKESYLKRCKQGNIHVGLIQIVPIYSFPLKYIVNMITQSTYGRTGIHVDYDAVSVCMDKLLGWCKARNLSISIPKIGCGLAGGSWDRVEGIILDSLKNHDGVDVDVYYL